MSLRGSIAPGYALRDRLDALQGAVKEMNLPAAYTTKITGRGRELERTFKEFLWAFLLSVIFMYMILASQYESLVHPFTILLSLPLSLPFALFSSVTNNTLNLYSALAAGAFGVVKKNAILQIDHMKTCEAAPTPDSVCKAPRSPSPNPDDDPHARGGMIRWRWQWSGAEERRAVPWLSLAARHCACY